MPEAKRNEKSYACLSVGSDPISSVFEAISPYTQADQEDAMDFRKALGLLGACVAVIMEGVPERERERVVDSWLRSVKRHIMDGGVNDSGCVSVTRFSEEPNA